MAVPPSHHKKRARAESANEDRATQSRDNITREQSGSKQKKSRKLKPAISPTIDKGNKEARQSGPVASHQPTPFLDLPAELHNSIYEYSALHYSAVLRPKARGRLLTNTPLTRVSHQIRAEYAAILFLAAPTITAHIHDLDFSHLVTFLNQLSDRELNALPSLTVPTARQILAELHITRNDSPGTDALHSWLLRCEHPTKKGTNIKMSYVVHGRHVFIPSAGGTPDSRSYRLPTSLLAAGGTRGPPPHIDTPVGDLYWSQKAALGRMEEAEMGEGRVYEELRKVVAALKVPRPLVSGVRKRY
ncbi:hypothetical protein B0A55_10549 [Friedmanniomyces simplex]|uniref:F-box domain-containing protein n=1 Tax=Friedmanniomyces simplex TaxID=329884 RepID=A0A4U0WNI3_9PEZI|nr:hypothetical protein B0A55_10549 [Friedmanniomyces simplex]